MSLPAHRSHLVLSILGCFGGGSLYGWSGYQPAVRAQFDVSNAAASMVFSLALVSFTCGVLLGPALVAKVPPRSRLPLLASLATLSLGVSGIGAGFTGFALAYGLSFGFASGMLYNYAITAAAQSGAATLFVPLSVAAFGLGGVVFGPVHVWLADAGWGLWSLAPALACLASVAGAALFVIPSVETAIATQPAFRLIKSLNKTTACLWVIFAAGSCSGLIVLGFAVQFLPQATEGVGLASMAIFLAALGNTLGRLCSAVTAVWFGPARGIAGALILSVLTLVCLIFTTTPTAVVGLLFFVAFAYGQLAATIPLLVKTKVEDAEFSSAFGLVFTGWGVAGLVGPWTAGWLLDATGTLRYSLVACICLATLSLWLVLRFTTGDRAKQEC